MTKNTIIILLILTIAVMARLQGIINISTQNKAYKEGMLYAYDNVVVCGASPEEEGLRLAKNMGLGTVSDLSCEE